MAKPVQIIAASDIGSNSIHMLLAYLNPQGKLVTLRSYRKILSLGSSLTKKGDLPPSAIENTCLALEKMKDKALYYRPYFIIVATHAVRAARNGKKLTKEVYRTTKLPVKILPGEEEARLMGLAISHSFFIKDKSLLCLDIGGGSTEFAIYKNGKPLFLKSLPLGSVTLTSRYLKTRGRPLGDKQIQELKKSIRETLKPVVESLKKHHFKKAIICSGLGKTLAFMEYMERTGRNLKNPDRYLLYRKSINSFLNRISRIKHPAKIKEEWKISANRSEIILAGTIILQTLTEELKIPFWTVSNYGIREGLILDCLKKTPKHARMAQKTQDSKAPATE